MNIKMVSMPAPVDHSPNVVNKWMEEIDAMLALGYLVKLRPGFYILGSENIEQRTREQGFTNDLWRWSVYNDDGDYFEDSYKTLEEAVQAVVDAGKNVLVL